MRTITSRKRFRAAALDDPATQGLRLLLLSLGVLFVAGLVGLWFAPGRTEPLRVVLPSAVWASTVCLLVGGFLLRRALHKVRRYERPAFRAALVAGSGAGLLFLFLQTPALLELLERHRTDGTVQGAVPGLLFFLVLLHAVHVAVGLAALGWVTARALTDPRRYTPDYHAPVRYAAMYWQFLEALWLLMLTTFLVV